MTRAELLAVAKPGLFNTAMVRAIREERKAATRRLMKPQPVWKEQPAKHRVMPSCWWWNGKPMGVDIMARGPHRVGDYLYVRETWQQFNATDIESGIERNGYIYLASADEHDCKAVRTAYKHCYGKEMPWRPSIHMPKVAARLFLRVIDVRAARLQYDFFVSGSPIFAIEDEGIDIGDHCRQCIDTYGHPVCIDVDVAGGSECGMLEDARSAFAQLWDRTVRPADIPAFGWAGNPWVWVYSFERVVPDDE